MKNNIPVIVYNTGTALKILQQTTEGSAEEHKLYYIIVYSLLIFIRLPIWSSATCFPLQYEKHIPDLIILTYWQ